MLSCTTNGANHMKPAGGRQNRDKARMPTSSLPLTRLASKVLLGME
jgi:hypothetical protein